MWIFFLCLLFLYENLHSTGVDFLLTPHPYLLQDSRYLSLFHQLFQWLSQSPRGRLSPFYPLLGAVGPEQYQDAPPREGIVVPPPEQGRATREEKIKALLHEVEFCCTKR